MKQVESYFKDYPESKECFTTADGQVFHKQEDANLHARSLEDKDVEEHKIPKTASAENAKAEKAKK
jgi:hypothetical protein